MKMNENCDVHCVNGDKELNKDNEINEIEHNNETANYKEKVLNESLENNDPNSDTDTGIFNKTLKDIDIDPARKYDEFTNNNILKKFSKIIDNDSEDENMFILKRKREKPVYNSSEGETSDSKEIIKSKKHLKKKSTKIFLNSDSDEMCGTINNSDSNEKSSKSGENGKKVTNTIQSRFKTLVDSESDEEYEKQLCTVKNDKHKKQKERRESKMRKVSSRAAKEEAMKQIQSETQRLVRESEISLPYHKPKQRTLQEFMSRKKVLTVLPKAPTMAVKLKMSSAIIDEALKEKEKEAEIFYKSSDSEEEMARNHSLTDQENTNIERTQELRKDNVSRKLFVDTSLCTGTNKENSNANAMQETNETFIVTKDTESRALMTNDVAENNTNNSVILETHCETSCEANENKNLKSGMSELVEISKNNNAITKNKEVSDLPQKEDVENEDREKNVTRSSIDKVDNDTKNKLETVNDTLDASTLKINDDYAKIVKRSLGIAAEESDEYNEYGLPPPKFDDSPNINEKKTLLNVQNLKPKLRGTHGIMIDLSHNIKPNKKGINALINRFVSKHSKINTQVKDTSDVTITQIKESPNGLLILKETLPYKHLNLSNEDSKLNKPGAKLTHLREELKHKMALKREEEWKQKEQEMKEQEIEWNESINEEDNWSEPCSPNIESYKSTEDESDEDDDVYIKKERKRSKCAFIDSEAEVSNDEIDNSDKFIDEDEDENLEEDEKECERLILEDEDESNTCDSINMFSKPKTFKQIVESVEDDSRSCNTENSEDTINKDKKISPLRTTISANMFHAGTNENEEFSGNESDIPVSQMHVETDLEYQISQTPQSKINSFNFVSPVTQLTALNTRLESEMEPSHVEQQLLVNESDLILIGSTQTEELTQPIRNFRDSVMLQRKLFTDQNDVLDEELMELCSGKFTQDKGNLNLSKEPDMTESQLLELCSGSFTTQENGAKNLTNGFLDELSQDKPVSLKKNSTSIEETTPKEKQQLKKDEMYWNKLSVVSSDEEDLIEKEINNRRKKEVKKLDLSDDEEDNASLVSNDEQTEDEDNYIDYDSEENEIVVSKKNIRQYANKFLDEEAELSESDCDVSADEDENDLDKLELEEIDDEEIDDIEVKNKLGKLHMKHLIDKDKQEVNMLKELLFEDGDLFSESTRERKLRWKNIDKYNNESFQPSEDKDGWCDVSDEEDEAKWCRLRHEREKFLAKRMENVTTEIENDLNKSQIFKFGMKCLKKKRISETEMQCTLLETRNSEENSRIPRTIAEMLNNSNLESNSHAIHSAMQKRSFLARGEKSLVRMAVMAKQKDAPLKSINTKKFVFTYVNPSTVKTEAKHYKSEKKC